MDPFVFVILNLLWISAGFGLAMFWLNIRGRNDAETQEFLSLMNDISSLPGKAKQLLKHAKAAMYRFWYE